MAPIISLQLSSYESDLGIVYDKVRFKLKQGYGLAGGPCGDYELPDSVCSSALLFKTRAAVVTFDTGEKIRYPIGRPQDILGCLKALKAANNVICIDLDGEEWGQVPATVANYTPVNTRYTLTTGVKSEKNTGSFDYTSDVLGLIRDKFAIENDPSTIAASLYGCLDAPGDPDACAISLPGFSARYVVATANRNVSGISGANPNSKIVRKGKVSLPSDIIGCIQSVGNVVACVGYKGESIRNVHNLLP